MLQARRDRAARTWVGHSTKRTPLVSNKQSLKKTLSVALIRPFRMFSEPIVLATSLFMAMVYAIFYLFFEAYPIIFGGENPPVSWLISPAISVLSAATADSLDPGVYQMSTGISALAFIPSKLLHSQIRS